MMSIILWCLLTLIILIIAFLIWAASGIQSPKSYQGEILEIKPSENIPETKELTVLSWNIGYGQGLGSEGSKGYKKRTKEEFSKALDEMGMIISSKNPDLVLIQEIDFYSKRSHYQDQFELLKEKINLPYAAKVISWDAKYIPFPYWPISKHFGRVLSGGVVFSRFPISKNEIVLWEKPDSNPWWYNLYYLFRYSQSVQVKINQRYYWAINNHLEAFKKTNREEQGKGLQQLGNTLSEQGELLLIGGDLNTVPTVATKKSKFSGYPKDNYEADETLESILKINSMKDSVPPTIYSCNESKYVTFPCDIPDRKLDYLIYNEKHELKEFEVIEAGCLSDHLPIMIKLALAPS